MKVAKGNKVKVEYEGKLEDGTVFDSSTHGDHSHPLEFVAGNGQVINGFEKAIEGMELGEEKEFKLSAEEAYGEIKDDLVQKIPREALPKDREPEKGMMLVLQSPDGRQFPVKIVEVSETEVTVDLNHPLAGKALIFKIKVVEIEPNSK